jgi:hypothetical protein
MSELNLTISGDRVAPDKTAILGRLPRFHPQGRNRRREP